MNKRYSEIQKAKNNDGLALKTQIQRTFARWLSDTEITEICINKPEQLFYEKHGQWFYEDVPELSLETCQHLATMLATFRGVKLDTSSPILSGVLPDGQRVQVVIPPACTDKTVCFTIRQPSTQRYSLDYYQESGFFDSIRLADEEKKQDNLIKLYRNRNWFEFLKQAVIAKKNIVVTGETGSGKTTFMKTLIDLIPTHERLITIEDTPEINFTHHQNYVQLYYPSEAKPDDTVTATKLLKSCMRMKPDRILITELRGGETFDFIQALSSGHSGSITSAHTSGVIQTFDRLALMVKSSHEGNSLDYKDIQRLLHQTIDLVLHIDVVNGKRFIDEAYYKEDYKQESINEFK